MKISTACRLPSAITLAILAAPVSVGAIELPKKAPLTRYAPLWTNSCLTSKPPPPIPVPDPCAGLALRGVIPLPGGGYLITLVEVKNPARIITIDPQCPSDFKVLKITHDPDEPLGTTVHLTKDGVTGTVKFDQKLMTPKARQSSPPQPGQPAISGQPRPRPRVVPPAQYGGAATQPTSMPPRPANPPIPSKNPFENLALRGVAPMPGGHYLITLAEGTNPAKTIRIDTTLPSEFEVLKIERVSEKPLATVVHLKQGDRTGTVTYRPVTTSQKTTPPPPTPAPSPSVPGVPGQAPTGVRPQRR